MKALLMEEYKKLRYTDVPDPQITGGRDILVRVKAVSICGSDVHGFDGSTGRRKPPIIMGHEAAGDVVAAGGEAVQTGRPSGVPHQGRIVEIARFFT